MKDSYNYIGLFFSISGCNLPRLTSNILKYIFFLVAGIIGFTSAVINEYFLNILGRYVVVTAMACANPTPGSVFPTFQVAGNCYAYSQFIPAACNNALLYVNERA